MTDKKGPRVQSRSRFGLSYIEILCQAWHMTLLHLVLACARRSSRIGHPRKLRLRVKSLNFAVCRMRRKAILGVTLSNPKSVFSAETRGSASGVVLA
jgi:hypothetical protein